ncbi:hypothetical protein K470DRAFT_299285, partial [Piedraia hortae CBS 480.64]
MAAVMPSTMSFVFKRWQSTAGRTRKALRVKPSASFLPSTTESMDHIIFNPPSSAPDVYRTPVKFLPENDPRKSSAGMAALSSGGGGRGGSAAGLSGNGTRPSGGAMLGSTVRPPAQAHKKKYHLTPTEVEEIRTLRASDPRTWTRLRLAEKFGCSQFFISLCCSGPEEYVRKRREEVDAIREKWGPRKREARELRAHKRGMWGRDE